jgi:hypothetical protein
VDAGIDRIDILEYFICSAVQDQLHRRLTGKAG